MILDSLAEGCASFITLTRGSQEKPANIFTAAHLSSQIAIIVPNRRWVNWYRIQAK
jgi:hypothetical protein